MIPRVTAIAFVLVALPCASGAGESHDWPSFRGPGASGVAPDGQDLPAEWSVETGDGVAWKTAVPGLAHSSPIVVDDLVIVTSAITSRDGAGFRPGLYGDGDASTDRSEHRFVVIAYARKSGEPIWERTSFVGEPRDRRHIKATYANSTPASDGVRVAAFFGSQGLYVYDMSGELLWQKDLGRLDVGAYDLPSYEWGPASSPILWQGRVILQVDTQGDSYVVAFDGDSGRELWRTVRDELPSWGSPTVVPSEAGPELVTNGSNFVRGYDPRSGEELWRLGGSSKITAPTPIFADGLALVASGRAPERPIFAVRPGSRGDLTLDGDATSSAAIAWSWTRRGSYMPTPIAVDGRLYVLANQGIFDCYGLEDGREIYRERVAHGGLGFSASPVAADGLIYLPSEDGDMFVVRAGDDFEVVARNDFAEPLMATPAISRGVLYVRGRDHLFAVTGP